MSKLVLGIDTSTLTASVAIVRGDARSADVLTTGESHVNTHSQQLLGLIDAALDRCRATLADIDGIAIGAGPGSFTGLRIGMATAKGLAFSTETPLWAVSSLAALALHASTCASDNDASRARDSDNASKQLSSQMDALVIPILDARRSEVFVGFYRVHGYNATAVSDELVLSPDALGPTLETVLADQKCTRIVALGDGLSVYPEKLRCALGARVSVLEHAADTPPAAAVARLALVEDREDIVISGAPSYIRLSEAEIKYPNGNPGGAFKTRT